MAEPSVLCNQPAGLVMVKPMVTGLWQPTPMFNSTQETRRDALPALAIGAASAFVMLGPAIADAAEEPPSAVDPLVVEVPGIVVPFAREGRLLNYLFLSLMLRSETTAGADVVRFNQFMVRDAIVREAGKSPVPPGSRAGTYNLTALRRMVLAAVNRRMTDAKLAGLTVRDARFMRVR